MKLTGRKMFAAAVAASVALAGCLGVRTRPAGLAYVDEFDLSNTSCGYGKSVKTRLSVDGHPLTMGGKTYARGFGTHAESVVAFASNGKVSAFDALVGIDADGKKAQLAPSRSAATFRVWADGKVIFATNVTDRMKPVPLHVALAGAREIWLETRSGECWTDFCGANADWADARFTCLDGATLEVAGSSADFAQLGILTPAEKPEPQFNGADIWGVRPGHPVIFRIPVSGARPMRFTSTALPAGVTLDAEKGILGGVAPEKPGSYDITVTASNAKGRATRVIRLQVGQTITLTPPMGWNSWNVWCYRLTQEHALASAKALQDSGLGDHGWAYVNLDDWWEMNNSGCKRVEMRKKDFGGREDVIGPARDAKGKIIPNRSFPDMRKMTDTIHSYGFKAGLYSSPGALTCGQCEGSLGHEREDAESWADWGFDYIKYDWCSYGKVFARETGLKNSRDKSTWTNPKYVPAFIKPYRIMGEHLRAQKRDIVFSLCQYGMANTQEWGPSVGANCWRSWDDLKDGWAWMEQAIDSHISAEYWKYNQPGFWADPDMMIVGQQYSFGGDHPTFLTPNEQYTHVSIWAMISSPMLLGCDLTKLDAFTRSLLVNDEVIAISQDRLGKVARRIRHVDTESVWVRPLANGDFAVALMSRAPLAREIRVSLAELGLSGGWKVRDCWSQKDEGRIDGELVAVVPPHATKLVRLSPVTCSKCD